MRFYRWVGFVMAIWVMDISGTNYAMSNYSSALKDALNIDQVQLNTLSVGKDLGKMFGIVAGIVSVYLPAWALLLAGAGLGLLGFGAQWLVVAGVVNPLPYWMMFVACTLAGTSVAWYNTAVLLVCVKNFPRNRGPMLGLLKAYLGLSPSIFSAFCDYLFSGTASHFLLLLTLVPLAVCVIAAPFLRPVVPATSLEEENEERTNVLWFNILATSLALYILFVEIFSTDNAICKWVYASILLLLLVAPILVPMTGIVNLTSWAHSLRVAAEKLSRVAPSVDAKKVRHTDVESCERDHSMATAREPLLGQGDTDSETHDLKAESVHDCKETSVQSGKIHADDGFSKRPLQWWRGCYGRGAILELGEDHSCAHLLGSVDFWVFYVSCLCSGGAGVAFSNNLGQIGEAIGFDDITVFTAIFGVGGFGGRILSGLVSEHFLRKAGTPRSVWMALTKAPMVVTLVWLSGGTQQALYTSTMVLGFCFGFQMAIMVPMVSEFYGLKHFGTNYNISTSTLLVGSVLFSDLLAGTIYDREALKQLNYGITSVPRPHRIIDTQSWLNMLWPRPFLRQDTTVTCYGTSCYRLTFILLAIILIIGLLLDVLLAYMTRPLYKRIQKINTAAIQ